MKISIIDPDDTDREAALVYKYQRPEGNINVHPLSVEDDLIDEVKEEVTEQELQAYNNALPTQKEIEDYNNRNTLYENAKKNAYCVRLEIINNGNGKANDVYIDLQFPNGLLPYYDYDIEDIEKPKDLKLPDNPVWKALDNLHASRMSGSAIATLLQLSSQWENIGMPLLNTKTLHSINVDRLRPGYFERDHSVNDNHDTTTIGIDSLIHSRTYTSDKIWFIATQKGTFTIDCKIMCEEYKEPGKYSFKVEIE